MLHIQDILSLKDTNRLKISGQKKTVYTNFFKEDVKLVSKQNLYAKQWKAKRKLNLKLRQGNNKD